MNGTRALTIAAFTAAIAMLGAVEWAARRPGSTAPTLGEVCAAVMHYRTGALPVGRIAEFGFWWWVGWHFFAR